MYVPGDPGAGAWVAAAQFARRWWQPQEQTRSKVFGRHEHRIRLLKVFSKKTRSVGGSETDVGFLRVLENWQVTLVLKYIELKTGFTDNGPAWIGRVKVSKSARTVYFNGRALKQGGTGSGGNFHDLQTGESYWVSGVKRTGGDRHKAGSGRILIEAAAVAEYLTLTGETSLDTSRFAITHDIRETDPAAFIDVENKPLNG